MAMDECVVENSMPERPSLNELGSDLTHTTAAQVIIALSLPFLAIASYFLFAFAGAWIAALLSVIFLSFITYGSTTHDLVHANLGLPKRVNDGFLFLIEMLCLRSGTAYRATHLHHHKNFPHADDVEAAAAGNLKQSLLGAPLLQLRLWLWAWQRCENKRVFLAVEAAWIVFFICTALLWAPHNSILLIYAVLVIGATWIFPVVTVYIPHDPKGSDYLTQTRRFRGRFFSVIAFDHLYHLEHHMYPVVPRHHWKELAQRLDPFLNAHKVPAITLAQLKSINEIERR
jgi:beta-carotene hydroxylase